jgi:hypothetical protein
LIERDKKYIYNFWKGGLSVLVEVPKGRERKKLWILNENTLYECFKIVYTY